MVSVIPSAKYWKYTLYLKSDSWHVIIYISVKKGFGDLQPLEKLFIIADTSPLH